MDADYGALFATLPALTYDELTALLHAVIARCGEHYYYANRPSAVDEPPGEVELRNLHSMATAILEARSTVARTLPVHSDDCHSPLCPCYLAGVRDGTAAALDLDGNRT